MRSPVCQFLPMMVQHYSICYSLKATCERKWESGKETMNVDEEVAFFIDGYKLEKEKCFKYLGTQVTKNCKLL